MTERICTCGHAESEHGIYNSCLHEIKDLTYCKCMQFTHDNTRSELIEANELISAMQNEIESLREDRGDLLLQVNAYNTLMPCGHLARYAVTADEGTSFCLMCEYQARR